MHFGNSISDALASNPFFATQKRLTVFLACGDDEKRVSPPLDLLILVLLVCEDHTVGRKPEPGFITAR